MYEAVRQAVDTAVMLPGTGSDEVFVTEAFGGPVADAGLRLVAPRPKPGNGLVAGHLAALDEAAEDGPIVVGGISLGAHVAAEWARDNPTRCAGLLLAMPGWCGDAADAPAALAARGSADTVDALGMDRALAAATEGVPDWLGEELRRAWRRAGSGLAASLRVAASHPAPTVHQLRGIGVPAGVAGCTDDPVHPAEVARSWAEALPSATLESVTLAELGADRAALGRASVTAWLRAAGEPLEDLIRNGDRADHERGSGDPQS